MDTSRGNVPAEFALQGCVNTSGIWIRNSRSIPVRVSTAGDVGPRQVLAAANVTLAADVTWGLRGDRSALLMPGQLVFYPVGSGAASTTISNDQAAASIYLVADGLLAVLGGTALGDKFKKSGAASTAVQLVTELTDVLQKYHDCATGASRLKRLACDAILTRDVGFALARFSFSLGTSALSKIATLVVALAHQWNFTAHLNGDLNAVSNGHGTIALRAIIPPPQSARVTVDVDFSTGAWSLNGDPFMPSGQVTGRFVNDLARALGPPDGCRWSFGLKDGSGLALIQPPNAAPTCATAGVDFVEVNLGAFFVEDGFIVRTEAGTIRLGSNVSAFPSTLVAILHKNAYVPTDPTTFKYQRCFIIGNSAEQLSFEIYNNRVGNFDAQFVDPSLWQQLGCR